RRRFPTPLPAWCYCGDVRSCRPPTGVELSSLASCRQAVQQHPRVVVLDLIEAQPALRAEPPGDKEQCVPDEEVCQRAVGAGVELVAFHAPLDERGPLLLHATFQLDQLGSAHIDEGVSFVLVEDRSRAVLDMCS